MYSSVKNKRTYRVLFHRKQVGLKEALKNKIYHTGRIQVQAEDKMEDSWLKDKALQIYFHGFVKEYGKIASICGFVLLRGKLKMNIT